jgi:hypothetical protein
MGDSWRKTKSAFVAIQVTSMKASWQKQVLAFSGYCELGMFDDAAQALDEIEPEDKTGNEVLYARVDIYLAAKK